MTLGELYQMEAFVKERMARLQQEAADARMLKELARNRAQAPTVPLLAAFGEALTAVGTKMKRQAARGAQARA